MNSDPYNLSARGFQGRVHEKGLKGGDASAVLTVTPQAVVATLEDGRAIKLPLGDLRLRRDAGGGLVVSAEHRAVTCADPDFLRALETAGGNDLNDQISRLAGERVSRRGAQLLGCLAILGVVWLLWRGLPWMFGKGLDAAVAATPTSIDESLGEATQEAMDAGGKVVEDEEVRAAIQAMLDRLAPHAREADDGPWEFHFRVVDNDQINAFALPGGYITVFTGLITESDRPEQVAGVLAHEMAHVTLRHGMYRIAHSLGMIAGVSLLFGDLGGLESVAVELFTLSTVNSYSQEQESAADAEGVRMMVQARIDPEALVGFFRLLEEKYGDVPESLSWLSTHPQHAERIDAIRRQVTAGSETEWEPLGVDWEAVRAKLE